MREAFEEYGSLLVEVTCGITAIWGLTQVVFPYLKELVYNVVASIV